MVHVHGQLFEELREFVFLFYSLRVCWEYCVFAKVLVE